MKTHGAIYDAIETLRVRPAMFIGRASIFALDSYLMGFRDGVSVAAQGEILEESPPFHEFSRWVAEKLGRGPTVEGWSRSICAGAKNEEQALDDFFVLLDE
jgi:hypothetical protein